MTARRYRVAAIPGDGIGPEVVGAARTVVDAAGEAFDFTVEWQELIVGGAAIDRYGTAIRDEDLAACRAADAVLLGAVGGPRWDDPGAAVRPEQALFAMRGGLGLYANLRPVTVDPALVDASPLRPERLAGVDLLILRELTGGLYFGKPSEERVTPAGREAIDTLVYTEGEIRRLVRLGFEMARGRRHHVTSVDKANVLATSRLWRKVVEETRADFPDVTVEHRLVDAAAMLLIQRPAAFDVIVTENLFGDILSDEASVLAGSLGMLPSASLGDRLTDRGTLRALRAHPRLRPRHRRPGQGQPDRHHPLRGDAAALVARRGRRGAGGGERRDRSAGRWARHGGPGPDGRHGRHDRGDPRPVGGPPRRGRRARREGRPVSDPVVLYDTTLRDGTQGEGLVLSLADKLKIAHRLDDAGLTYIEGGWPGSNPKDVEFFAEARRVTWRQARIAAFGSTRHRSNRPADDPNLQALVAAGTPVVTIFGKSWLLHVTRGPGRHRRGEPGHGRRLGGLLPRRRPRGGLRRGALLRRLQGRSGPMPWPPCARPSRPAPRRSSCATRTAAA